MDIQDNYIGKYYSEIELDYKASINEIPIAFNIENVKIEDSKDSLGDGFVFESNIGHQDGRIDFSIIVENKLRVLDNPKVRIGPYLKLYFYYYNKFGLLLFDNFKVYSLTEYKKEFIKKWLDSTIEQFERHKDTNLLDLIFGDRAFKVYGRPETSIGSALAFEIVLKGYVETNPSEILIYKLKHYEDGGMYKVFSYAIFHSLKRSYHNYSYWSVFPAFCSPDSGTASQALNYVESLIEEINSFVKVTKKEVYINYDEMKKKFILEEKKSIHSWDEYDPFKEFGAKLDKIQETVVETNIITKQINEKQDKLRELIQTNPDIVAEKLKQALNFKETSKDDESDIKEMLSKYSKITDIIEKSEYWLEKIKILAKLLVIFV